MDADTLDRFEKRPAREADLDDVVRLMEAADRALGIPPEPIREVLTWTWHLPTTDLRRDTRIVRDDGVVVAYGEAFWKHPSEGGPMILTVRVHPDYTATGIDSRLFAWGEPIGGCLLLPRFPRNTSRLVDHDLSHNPERPF